MVVPTIKQYGWKKPSFLISGNICLVKCRLSSFVYAVLSKFALYIAIAIAL